MRKIIAIGNTLFIYLIVGYFICMYLNVNQFIDRPLENALHIDSFDLILYFGIFMYILGIIFLCINLKMAKKSDRRKANQLAKSNMVVKLIQIPAYIFMFVVGLICLFNIVIMRMIIVLVISLDCMSIGLTGLFAMSTFITLKSQGKITKGPCIIFSILSFTFCIDVIVSVFGFILAKRLPISNEI